MRKIFVFSCFLFLLPVLLSAQTAAELETILQSPTVTCTQAARFVLASLADITVQDRNNAFERVMANGWLPKNTLPDENITLRKLSFLIMKAFDMKGGLMYLIFPSQRYAYRTMVSRSYIQGASDPAMLVSGERFLHILGRVLSAEGNEP
ncbi:MAG: hypothetical protein FWD13_08735 [Treponema sp.]|nr:hypothetical protein [Treponema sp.]